MQIWKNFPLHSNEYFLKWIHIEINTYWTEYIFKWIHIEMNTYWNENIYSNEYIFKWKFHIFVCKNFHVCKVCEMFVDKYSETIKYIKN